MLKTKYSLANSHQSLNASDFNILCNVAALRDLLRAIVQFLNTLRLAMQVATYIYIYILHFTLVSVVTGGYYIPYTDRSCRFCRFWNIYPRSCKKDVSYKLSCLQCKLLDMFTNNIPSLQ